MRNYRRYTRRHIKRFDLSITLWLIIINVVFFIFGFFLIIINQNYINLIALKPSNILQGKYFWTLITSMFMHAGIFHLLINMFVLFSLGSLTEKIIGRQRFLWFYIFSGLFAGLSFVILAGFFGNSQLGNALFGNPETFAVGASGAIFAIAGLFIVLLPKIRFSIIFFPFFSLPGYIMVPLVLSLTWLASIFGNLPIGNSAHLGGFLMGLIYGFYLRRKYKNKVKALERMFEY